LKAGEPCPLSFPYQAVRNLAASRALAGGRHAVSALVYDARNPFFAGCGAWPGWPAALAQAVSRQQRVLFRSISWQELIRQLPLDENVRAWACEKHELHAQ
jgi:hypothetical protein